MFHSGLSFHSGLPIASQNRPNTRDEAAAMLKCPSLEGKTPVGMPVGMVVAGLLRDLLVDQPPRRLEVQHEDLRFEQARVHPAADAGAGAVEQRHRNAEREQIAGSEVGDRQPDAHRPLAGQAGDGHQPAHALHDLVDARALAVRPGLAEAADAAVDDPRIDLAHVVIGNLEPMLHRRAHVFHDHIGARRQAS